MLPAPSTDCELIETSSRTRGRDAQVAEASGVKPAGAVRRDALSHTWAPLPSAALRELLETVVLASPRVTLRLSS